MNLSNYSKKDLEAVASEYHNSKNQLLSDMAVNAAYEINTIDEIEALNKAISILDYNPTDNRVQSLINKLKDACQDNSFFSPFKKYIREGFGVETPDEYIRIDQGSLVQVVSPPKTSYYSSSGFSVEILIEGRKVTIDAGLLCDGKDL